MFCVYLVTAVWSFMSKLHSLYIMCNYVIKVIVEDVG